MTVHFFIHSIAKRAKATALLDSGATGNFMNLSYAKWLKLPIKELAQPWKLFNMDNTENISEELKHYTDLQVQTGNKTMKLWFFLTHIGKQKAILGYPWFAANQPKIDWKQGWIDHTQLLPIILWADNTKWAIFTPQSQNVPQPIQCNWYFIRSITIHPKKLKDTETNLPDEYKQHKKVFNKQKSQRLPWHTIWDHAIELLPNAPKSLPSWLLPLMQEEIMEVHKFVDEYLKRGTIRESWSPYMANFFFIKKKDEKLWPIQNYRPLNKWTIKNWNMSPLIPATIDHLSGCTLFTKFDIRWGYNNIRIKPGDEWKAAFLTLKGLFKPRVMFFGLTNSPATFQMMMNTIFWKEVAEGWLSIYMDNIAIHSKRHSMDTKEQHCQQHKLYVYHILDKLKKHNLYLKPEKCMFKKDEIDYLGVIISNGIVKMDLSKLKGVADWPKPKTPTKIRQFLGFTGYYQYFIPKYSKIAQLLLDLTKKDIIWKWEERQQNVFEELKTHMCYRPVLQQPDFGKKFYFQADTSLYSMGTVLSQEGNHLTQSLTKQQKPILHPVAYYLATFMQTERNYDIYERELLAVMKALVH